MEPHAVLLFLQLRQAGAHKSILGTDMVGEGQMSPKQKQHSLWKSLKVVVSVDLCAVLKSYLAKHLWAHRGYVRGVNSCPLQVATHFTTPNA